jgi:hypothetical protein
LAIPPLNRRDARRRKERRVQSPAFLRRNSVTEPHQPTNDKLRSKERGYSRDPEVKTEPIADLDLPEEDADDVRAAADPCSGSIVRAGV